MSTLELRERSAAWAGAAREIPGLKFRRFAGRRAAFWTAVPERRKPHALRGQNPEPKLQIGRAVPARAYLHLYEIVSPVFLSSYLSGKALIKSVSFEKP